MKLLLYIDVYWEICLQGGFTWSKYTTNVLKMNGCTDRYVFSLCYQYLVDYDISLDS